MKTIKRLLATCIACVISTLFAYSAPSLATVWAYKDADGDGYASKIREIDEADAPKFEGMGWLISEDKPERDCDDTNANIYRNVKLGIDNDGDGYNVGYVFLCIGDVIPVGYIIFQLSNGHDPDDNNPSKVRTITIYKDSDGDGWTTASKQHNHNEPLPGGWTTDKKGSGDCAPTDPSKWRKITIWDDGDKDGVSGPQSKLSDCIGNEIPEGWLEFESDPWDCDLINPKFWTQKEVFPDPDGDFHVPMGTVTILKCSGETAPPGYIFPSQRLGSHDCAPGDGTKWRNVCVKGNPNTTECVGAVNPNPCGTGSSIEYTVYPNPVSARLNISPTANWNEKVEIKLVDQYGRVLRSMQVPNGVKGQTFSFNTADLKPGIYQLIIRRGEIIESKTIAVKL